MTIVNLTITILPVLGLVTHLIPHRFAPNGTLYLRSTVESWRTLLGHLPALPDVRKFPEETWEWTIGRDFKDRVIGGGYISVSQHCYLKNK